MKPFPVLDRTPVDLTTALPDLWLFLGQMSDDFPGSWVLIGGLMVFLLGAEHGQTPLRETTDADALVNARLMPRAPSIVSRYLVDAKFEFAGASSNGVGHRFVRGDLIVDVVAPDHLGTRADLSTIGSAHTVQAPAGTRLLDSSERCPVQIGNTVLTVPRPTLDAALVGKSAALSLPDRQRHAEDLAFLLGIVPDPRIVKEALSRSDLRQLSRAKWMLEDEHVWKHAGDPRSARAALKLLLG